MTDPAPRHFVLLQGPHGPMFAGLARRLMAAGHTVSRIGFNAGDRLFWRGMPEFTPFHGHLADWQDWLETYLERVYATDVVFYGASRPVHATARKVADDLGLTLHAFEEGYLRPYWITYERGGTNAASPLNDCTLDQMRSALDIAPERRRPPPDRWGDMRQHVFWGMVYHAALLVGQKSFPAFTPHRTPPPKGELAIYARHLASLPWRRLRRRITTWNVAREGFPYHVVLLQLAHDANFRDNGPFASQHDFLDVVCAGFARGAPSHHHLVLKAHPMEDGREPLAPLLRRLTARHALQGRLHLVTGGKLARLLDAAVTAVTVNSTSAEQALWRGLPVKAFGKAVYVRPKLTSHQSLPDFFANPIAPDPEAYAVYREFLLRSSQIAGGYYSRSGRRRLLRRLPDLMLAETCPMERLLRPAARGQHLAAVH